MEQKIINTTENQTKTENTTENQTQNFTFDFFERFSKDKNLK